MDSEQLQNQEMIFGFFWKRKNANFHILGKLKLLPDGRVEGTRRPQEGAWKVTDGVLSFFHLNGELTTRFDENWSADQSVLMGSSCVEPRLNFLFPYRPLSQSQSRLIYLISSCVGYEIPLRTILSQLRCVGVPSEQIWVTVARSDRAEVRCCDGITFSHVTENAYEHAALLDVARSDAHFDYAFLLHDTCHVGPRLRELIERQPMLLPWDYMSAAASGHFNIGLYRKGFLTDLLPFLTTLNGMSKPFAVDVELDRGGQGYKSRAQISTNFLDARRVVTGFHNYCEQGVFRTGVYLVGADVHKFYGSWLLGERGWRHFRMNYFDKKSPVGSPNRAPIHAAVVVN